jgi:hypothetical protein
LAAHALIGILALPAVLEKAPKKTIFCQILSRLASTSARFSNNGFVFGLPLQEIVATFGVLAMLVYLCHGRRSQTLPQQRSADFFGQK